MSLLTDRWENIWMPRVQEGWSLKAQESHLRQWSLLKVCSASHSRQGTLEHSVLGLISGATRLSIAEHLVLGGARQSLG